LKVIDDHYSENKSYIKKNIQFNINRDLDLIELAKKEAEIKKQDEAVLYNSLNKYLEDLIIICYQNEQLML